MSQFAALAKGAGALGRMRGAAGAMGAMSRMGGAAGAQMGALGKAAQATAAYQGVAKSASEKMTITLNYGQIGLILSLAMSYLVVASMGIDMFSKCDELKGKTTQENLNKWLVATLAIAIAIPFTLFITKVSGSKLTGVFTLLFAIMGVVGSSAALHWSRSCKSADESKKVYSGINVAVFLVMFLVGLFLLRPKKAGMV